jgi:hypothetical protein
MSAPLSAEIVIKSLSYVMTGGATGSKSKPTTGTPRLPFPAQLVYGLPTETPTIPVLPQRNMVYILKLNDFGTTL